jgi:tRNA (cmo5U34)-methyltransferase
MSASSRAKGANIEAVPTSAEPPRDRVFAEPARAVGDFTFDRTVAGVFDDMVSRSVPFYGEMQRMVTEMAGDFVTPGSNVYDLGCSTATTFLQLHPRLPASARFVGFDNSPEMLAKAREKLAAAGIEREVDLRVADLDQGAAIENASLVLMILTLQFIRPLNRERLMQDIYRGMNDQGCLILIEKVLGEDSLFNRLFIKYYYDMKRRHGYSELEISQKREALENVLIPYKLLENRELLLRTGFKSVDVFFKWYNFCGIIAVK